MKTNDLLTAGLLAGGGFLLWKMMQGGGLSPARPQIVAAANPVQAPAAPAGRVTEQKSAVESRFLPVPTLAPATDPYIQDDDPTLAERIQAVGDAAETSLDVIQNVFSGLTGLFGGTAGDEKAPAAVQESSQSPLAVPLSAYVYV